MALLYWQKQDQDFRISKESVAQAENEISGLESEIENLKPVFAEQREVEEALKFDNDSLFKSLLNGVKITKP